MRGDLMAELDIEYFELRDREGHALGLAACRPEVGRLSGGGAGFARIVESFGDAGRMPRLGAPVQGPTRLVTAGEGVTSSSGQAARGSH